MIKFIDDALDNKLKEFGYAKINNQLLSMSEVKTVLHKFYELFPNLANSHKTYIHLMEVDNKVALRIFSNFIVELLQKKLDLYLENIDILFGTLLIKKHNSNEFVNHHQDPTLSLYNNHPDTYTCWIPLQDVDIRNSCMGFIEKSHSFFNYIKPAPYPAHIAPIQHHNFTLLPYTKFVPLKTGQAVVFNSNTFHCSLPNITNQNRYAITLWIINKNSTPSFFYVDPNSLTTLLQYSINRDFFYRYDNNILYNLFSNKKYINEYSVIREINIENNKISKKQLRALVKKNGGSLNVRLFLYLIMNFPRYTILNLLKR